MKVSLTIAIFSPQNAVLPTDRQSFARNFACRSRFMAFNPRFGHRQAEKCPKLSLSVGRMTVLMMQELEKRPERNIKRGMRGRGEGGSWSYQHPKVLKNSFFVDK